MSLTDSFYERNFEVFYSSPERALTQLEQRRGNKELIARLRNEIFLIPRLKVLFNEPHLVMFRQVATPLLETQQFLKIASLLQIKPLIFEYHDDKFVGAGNTFKRALGKMPIFKHTSETGVDAFEYKTIVDFNANNGHLIKDVKTLVGESLLDFHHSLFEDFFCIDYEKVTVDLSLWFKIYNGNAAEYYEAFMSLFLRDAILCENFVTTPSEEGFSLKVVKPAFRAVCEKYGLDPLIIRVIEKGEETRQYWNCYPTEIGAILQKKGYS